MKNLTTEDTENTERENDLQCELAAWELLREATRERDEARERERVAIASWDEERQRALREGERVLEARRERDEAREAIRSALEERDREWFQIIESIAGFHPVSITDALQQGIARAKNLRALNNTKLGLDSIQRENQLRAELDQLKEGAK